MLLSETLAAVLSLAHPKLDDAASAAIVARPPQTDLSDIKADPCSDLFAREREQPYIDAVKAAARLQAAKQDSGSSGSGGVGGGGAGASVVEEVEAAQFELQEAERALQEHVLKPRERRRQLLIQVGVAGRGRGCVCLVWCQRAGALHFVCVLDVGALHSSLQTQVLGRAGVVVHAAPHHLAADGPDEKLLVLFLLLAALHTLTAYHRLWGGCWTC